MLYLEVVTDRKYVKLMPYLEVVTDTIHAKLVPYLAVVGSNFFDIEALYLDTFRCSPVVSPTSRTLSSPYPAVFTGSLVDVEARTSTPR